VTRHWLRKVPAGKRRGNGTATILRDGRQAKCDQDYADRPRRHDIDQSLTNIGAVDSRYQVDDGVALRTTRST
jgi:hypothetical protein